MTYPVGKADFELIAGRSVRQKTHPHLSLVVAIMFPFEDPTLDPAAILWAENGQEDDHLYPGIQEQIAEKLHAMVERCKWLYPYMMTLREARNYKKEVDLENESKPPEARDLQLRNKLDAERRVRQKIQDV